MEKVNAIIRPEGTLDILSKREVAKLLDTSQGGLYQLLRRCSLAVLNCGHETDDCREVFERHQDFGIRILQQQRGIHLELENAPGSAFVDGEMIRGIKEHLFAVLRDIIYTAGEITHNPAFDLRRSEDITNACFHILRNAGVLLPGEAPRLVVCWGGHSINRVEYDYTKEVGHELGLRELEVCTGCGPGAMKGPMKGAAIAHAKQRIGNARHIGVTEPGIIAAEPPNPIVTKLVIMPDIEKRLEAFVRLAHAVIVFPGGVGTAEEILYLLSILLDPANQGIPFPLILAGPEESADYFELLDRFLADTLGPDVRRHYRIVNGHPRKVARIAKESIQSVRQFRRQRSDAYYFNWQLNIESSLQLPFDPSHENMAKLELHRDQPAHRLAANLRRAFSGIVAGNVKAEGIRAVETHGPFELRGDPALMKSLDQLLGAFVAQHRMKLPGTTYVPCYRLAQ